VVRDREREGGKVRKKGREKENMLRAPDQLRPQPLNPGCATAN